VLDDKKAIIRSHGASISRKSAVLLSLKEGYQTFEKDLSKLQVGPTSSKLICSNLLSSMQRGFQRLSRNGINVQSLRQRSCIFRDKSKVDAYSATKVDSAVQPVFNRDVIAALSDSAASSLLELEAWINGEEFVGTHDTAEEAQMGSKGFPVQTTLTNLESDLYTALSRHDIPAASSIVSQLSAYGEDERRTTFTTVFLRTIADGPVGSLKFLLGTHLVDTSRNDEITDRGCLHEAAIAGRLDVVLLCVDHGLTLIDDD